MKAETEDRAHEGPVIEPVFFGYRELPDDPAAGQALFREMAEIQKAEGATFFRFHIVSPEHPNPPYPHGLYVEGWKDLPEGPWRQAPFNYPLTAETA